MSNNIPNTNNQKKELLIKLKGYLNAVFLNQELNAHLKSELIFQNNLNKILNIYKYLESSSDFQETKKYDEFLKAFNSYRIKNDQQEAKNNDDIDSIWDEVSGFRIFVLNTYNIDLDNQKEYFDLDFVYSEEDKTSYGFETKTNNHIEDEEDNFNTQRVESREQMFDNSHFFAEPQFTQDQRIEMAANNVLIQKIYRNEIYIYESKPKIIPILKYTFWSLLLLTVIFAIASYAIDIEFFKRIYVYDEIQGAKSLGSYRNGLPFSLMMTIIFFIIYSVNLFKGGGRKNENNYYSFKFTYPIVIILILTVSFFLTLFNGGFEFHKDSYQDLFLKLVETNNTAYDKSNGANPDIVKYTPENWNYIKSLMEATFVLRIMLFVILLLMIIVFIISFVFRPKYDHKRMHNLKEAIKDDIINNRIDLNLYQSQPSNFFKDFFR